MAIPTGDNQPQAKPGPSTTVGFVVIGIAVSFPFMFFALMFGVKALLAERPHWASSAGVEMFALSMMILGLLLLFRGRCTRRMTILALSIIAALLAASLVTFVANALA